MQSHNLSNKGLDLHLTIFLENIKTICVFQIGIVFVIVKYKK